MLEEDKKLKDVTIKGLKTNVDILTLETNVVKTFYYSLILRKSVNQIIMHIAKTHYQSTKLNKNNYIVFKKRVNTLKGENGSNYDFTQFNAILTGLYSIKEDTNKYIHLLNHFDVFKSIKLSDLMLKQHFPILFNFIGDIMIDLTKPDHKVLTEDLKKFYEQTKMETNLKLFK